MKESPNTRRSDGDTKKPRPSKPSMAPGDTDALEADATREEVVRGNYTPVTKLVWDEYDESPR
ncbi:MAG: hypothetical protein K6T63_04750 [Alicyclobacillus herbarius]|uniref:hypothetical protein n=1 Tax=Alicyclobacillus herbarius TaxID=122960 RepID=UPI00047E8FCC|nr:hypothetical protein [Alicyclobacillus herbarius]MCL6631924.1 hypothetical protein [Alicyclobacillus herbarius]